MIFWNQYYFIWAEENNMSFNNSKFELIRYGLNMLLKDSTKYFGPDGSEIEIKPNAKDLGVIMSSNGSFAKHFHNK